MRCKPMNADNDDDTEFRDWVERLPKVELHLHLEGAIPHDALWALIEKYGGDPAVPDRAALPGKFRYRDFPHFIETWIWKNGFLRGYDDFTAIAAAMASDLAAQNVRYAEVFFSPSRFAHHKLTPQQLALAIRAGLDQVAAVKVQLIADLVRDHGPDEAARTLAAVSEVRGPAGIVGIGIGGSEHSCPPEPFAPVYAKARDLGYRTTAHAGEAAGADSIRGAVEALGVERIGHGTRAHEDPGLVALLAERQIPLEVCPLSNVATGVVPEIAAHPVRRYWDQGLRLTINTDDPHMFNNSLADEFSALHQHFGFTPDEIRTLVLNAVEAAWLPAARREALRDSLTADPAWHGQ